MACHAMATAQTYGILEELYSAVFVGGVISEVWENLLEVFIDEPDYEWLMIDDRTAKYTGMQQGQEAEIKIWPHKVEINTKIYLTVDAHGMPVRVMYYSRHPCGLHAEHPFD